MGPADGRAGAGAEIRITPYLAVLRRRPGGATCGILPHLPKWGSLRGGQSSNSCFSCGAGKALLPRFLVPHGLDQVVSSQKLKPARSGTYPCSLPPVAGAGLLQLPGYRQWEELLANFWRSIHHKSRPVKLDSVDDPLAWAMLLIFWTILKPCDTNQPVLCRNVRNLGKV